MSTLKSDTLSNVAGTYSIDTERVARATAAAWVNFNGSGTVSVRSSYNVSSITDNAVGDYTVNFASALPAANYVMVGSADRATTSEGCKVHVYETGGTAPTTTACRIRVGQVSYGAQDAYICGVAFFR